MERIWIRNDMTYEKIPQELKTLDQWVCWSLVERDGKPTKLPINENTETF